MKIERSIALVTGANRGLGKALVLALVEAGAAKVYAAAETKGMAQQMSALWSNSPKEFERAFARQS